MYRMSESELMQYEMAHRRLEELRTHHAIELKRAYDDIHPTRIGYDYETGKLYSESINPAEYAIYLVDMQEEHARLEKWWSARAEVYQKAFSFLSDEDKNNLNSFSFKDRKTARTALKRILESIIETKKDLQRTVIPFEALEDIEEVDRRIDEMSMGELLEDYWDRDDVDAGIASGI